MPRLYVNEGEGTKVKVKRTWSNHSYHEGGWGTSNFCDGIMYNDGEYVRDNTIWYGTDVFMFYVEAKEGYELDYYSFGLQEWPFLLKNFSYAPSTDGLIRYTLTYDGDASITTSATPIATTRIYDGNSSSWNRYAIYIYDASSGWQRYTPYVYDGSDWSRYS